MKKFQMKIFPCGLRKRASHAAGFLGLFSMAFLLFPMMSCDNRNIHQVVRDLASAPVDTFYMEKRIVETNPFSSVDIDCFADVTYHQIPVGESHRVVIRAYEKVLDNIEVKVEQGELLVSVDRRYKMPEKAVAVVDIYSPFVSRFVLDGGKCFRLGKTVMTSPIELLVDGNVGTMIADSLSAHELSLVLNGTGSYQLKGIHTGRIKAVLKGGGNIELEGKCSSAQLTVEGDGHIDANGLKSDTAFEVVRK